MSICMYDLVRSCEETAPDLANEDLASAVLDAIQNDPDLFPLLLPGVLHEVTLFRRSRVRALEAEGWADLPAADPLADRRLLLASMIFIPGCPRVTWGSATIEDHQKRIDYLAKQVVGTKATIERHQEAIEAIRAAGVTCLDDLAQDGASQGPKPRRSTPRPVSNSARRASAPPKPMTAAPAVAEVPA